MYLIPLLALLLLISSFFAKVHRGVVYALIVLALVALQIFLGIFGHEAAIFGLLHGLNALILFSVAFRAGIRAGRPEIRPSMTEEHATA
jgi:cytochrome b